LKRGSVMNLLESALRSTPSNILAGSVTEPDHISIKIRELVDWQTIAWRRIANPDVKQHLNAVKFEIPSKLVMMSYGDVWR
jgi:hypothetical protein